MFDLVTVITLSYNSSHIWDTIDSVLEQDYPNIEYIISDDASENFDEEGIRQHVCRRKSGVTDFWIFTSPENMGTVKNLNRALKHGHGKYILLLSGDDTFASPDVVSTWVEYFHKHNYLNTGLISSKENFGARHSNNLIYYLDNTIKRGGGR